MAQISSPNLRDSVFADFFAIKKVFESTNIELKEDDKRRVIKGAWDGFIQSAESWMVRLKNDLPDSIVKSSVFNLWKGIKTEDPSVENVEMLEQSIKNLFLVQQTFETKGSKLAQNHFEHINNELEKGHSKNALEFCALSYDKLNPEERSKCYGLFAKRLPGLPDPVIAILVTEALRSNLYAPLTIFELCLYLFEHKQNKIAFKIGFYIFYGPINDPKWPKFRIAMIDYILKHPNCVDSGVKQKMIDSCGKEFIARSIARFGECAMESNEVVRARTLLEFFEDTPIFEEVLGHYVEINISRGSSVNAKDMLSHFKGKGKRSPKLELCLAQAYIGFGKPDEAYILLKGLKFSEEIEPLFLQVLGLYLKQEKRDPAVKVANHLNQKETAIAKIVSCLEESLDNEYLSDNVFAVAQVFVKPGQKKRLASVFLDFNLFKHVLALGGSLVDIIPDYLARVDQATEREPFLRALFNYLLRERKTDLIVIFLNHLDAVEDPKLKDRIYALLSRSYFEKNIDLAFVYACKIVDEKLRNEVLLELHPVAKKAKNFKCANECLEKLVNKDDIQQHLRFQLAIEYFNQKDGIEQAAKLRNQIISQEKILILLQLEAVNKIRSPQTQKIYDLVAANLKQNKQPLDSKTRQKLESAAEHLPDDAQPFVKTLLFPEPPLIDEMFKRGKDQEAEALIERAFTEALKAKDYLKAAEIRNKTRKAAHLVAYMEREAAAGLDKIFSPELLKELVELGKQHPKHPRFRRIKSVLSPSTNEDLNKLLKPEYHAAKLLRIEGRPEQAEELAELLKGREADDVYASLARSYFLRNNPIKANTMATKIIDDEVRKRTLDKIRAEEKKE